MEIRPIRTDEEHRAALAEIDALWDAPESSPDATRFDALVALVEAYEAHRWPVGNGTFDRAER